MDASNGNVSASQVGVVGRKRGVDAGVDAGVHAEPLQWSVDVSRNCFSPAREHDMCGGKRRRRPSVGKIAVSA